MSLCATLFTTAGNTLQVRSNGFVCGHQPVHSSASGTCVHINDTTDQWYCHPCTTGGGPVEALMSLTGKSRTDALAAITAMGGTTPSPPDSRNGIADRRPSRHPVPERARL